MKKVKDELEREFLPLDLFFIQKEGAYYLVRNYKGLLAILKKQIEGSKTIPA